MRRSLFFTISILLIIALGAGYAENLFNHGPSNVDGSASRTAKTNPSTVGVTNDLVGDLGSGTLSSDSVSFAISGFTSETSSCPTFGGCGGEIESNAYGIQINTNTFTCDSTFTGNVSATCWEQFVYSNCPNLSCLNYQTLSYGNQENIFIEYWLLGYLNSNSQCPSTSIPNGGMSWTASGSDCVADTTHLTATGEPPSNLGHLNLTATANAGGSDSVTLTDSSSNNSWTWSETDRIFFLSAHWTQAQANVFGDGNGLRANFNIGTSITVTQSMQQDGKSPFVPSCDNGGTTAESNNLFDGLCHTFVDGLSFTEASSFSTTVAVPLDFATFANWTGFEVTNSSALLSSNVKPSYVITPTGTVTYNFWTNSACSGAPVSSAPFPVTVTLGSTGEVPNAGPTGPLSAGSYSFTATYSGDPNYSSSASQCETFSVRPLQLVVSGGISAMTVFDSTGETSIYLTNSSGTNVGIVVLPPATTYPSDELDIAYSTSTSGGITNNNIEAAGAVVPYPPGKSILILTGGNNEVCIVDNPGFVSLATPPTCISTDTSQYQVLIPCSGVPYSFEFPDGSRTFTCTPVTLRTALGEVAYLRVDGLKHSFVETLTKGSPTISSIGVPAVPVGGAASDMATVSGGFGPSGDVIYTAYSDPSCTSQVFTDTEPLGFPSAPFTPVIAGPYFWIASYTGDVNNNPVATPCGSEVLVALQVTPTLTTATVNAANAPVTVVPEAASIGDTATLSGGYPSTGVTGTVSYALFGGSVCTGAALIPAQTLTVGFGNSIPPSTPITLASTGSYSFIAMYSGDINNNPVTSACEPFTVTDFTVNPNPSSVAISTGSTGNSTITVTTLAGFAGTVSLSDNNTACTLNPTSFTGSGTATLSCTFIGPQVTTVKVTGTSSPINYSATVTFNVTAQISCGTGCTITSDATINNITTNSTAIVFTATGQSGTTGFANVTIPIASVPNISGLHVLLNGTSLPYTYTTDGVDYFIHFTFHFSTDIIAIRLVPSTTPSLTTTVQPSSAITVGGSVTDQATLTGGYPSTGVSGTVTYYFLGGSTCTATTVISMQTFNVGPGNSVPPTSPITPAIAGNYSFLVKYSGDPNNAATSVCEPLIVNKTTPTITTSVTPATITIGSSSGDQATLTGLFNPTGSVTFNLYSDSACNVTVFISIEPVISPITESITPASAGTYYFTASYPGDANNAAVSSPCGAPGETLIVDKASPTITSLASPLTLTLVPTAVSHDTATLSGGYSPTGTVTYNQYSDSACTVFFGGGTVPLGFSSSALEPDHAQTYYFVATYNGDANNNPVSTVCGDPNETVTALKATPIVTTTIHDIFGSPVTSVAAASTVTDTATLTQGFPGAGTTGTVAYRFYNNTFCSGTGTPEGMVTIGLGNSIGPSNTVIIGTAGNYSFQATYSGNSDNNPAASPCETLAATDFILVPQLAIVNTVPGIPGNSTISISPVNGFTGTVTLHPPNPCTVTPTILTVPGNATLSCTFTAIGTYRITAAASSGSLSHSATVTFNVQGFTITATPKNVSALTGESKASVLLVSALNGFTGTVALTPSISPTTGIACILSQNSTTLSSSSQIVASTLSCSGSAGFYTVTVTGTSGSLTAIAIVTYTIQDFYMVASPLRLTIFAGSVGNSSVTIFSIEGFNGTVSLAETVSPSVGLTCSLTPSTIAGNGTLTLGCTGIGGIYVVTVNATIAGLSHSVMITYLIQDFSLSATPSSLTLNLGPPAGTAMVTVSPLGGFTGTVAFSAQAPSGLSTIFLPSTVNIAGTSLLTIGVSPPAVPGTYLVNITGTSGSIGHTVTITVTVTSANSVLPPVFTQSTWNHRFSLSKYADVQTWRFGVQDNSTTTIYFTVTVNGVEAGGTGAFIQTTAVLSEAPGKNLSNISLSQTFGPSQIGDTFTFTMTINWGINPTTIPSQLPFTSTTTNGSPTSGSFTILP